MSNRMDSVGKNLDEVMVAENTKIISLEELQRHNNRDDCWIAVHGVVMDITPFLNEHPGGPDVVVATAGTDCTDEFEDVGHTDSARRMGDKYIVGHLATCTPKCLPTNAEVYEIMKSKSTFFGTRSLLTGAAIAAVLAAIYYFAR